MSAHHAAGTDWVTIFIGYWWLILIFGGAVVEWVADTFDAGIGAMRRRAKLKHKRNLELKRVELEIEQAKAGTVVRIGAAKKPGPCVHRNVAPVVSADEEVVAWLCKSCDARLPADWAVREEDL